MQPRGALAHCRRQSHLSRRDWASAPAGQPTSLCGPAHTRVGAVTYVDLGGAMSQVLLGVDIGTGSSKAVLATVDGEILATSSRAHKMALPRPGWAQIDRKSTP